MIGNPLQVQFFEAKGFFASEGEERLSWGSAEATRREVGVEIFFFFVVVVGGRYDLRSGTSAETPLLGALFLGFAAAG